MSVVKYVGVVGKNMVLNGLAMLPLSHELKLKGLSLLGMNRYDPKRVRTNLKTVLEGIVRYNEHLRLCLNEDLTSFFKGKMCVEFGPAITLAHAQVYRCLGARVVLCCDIYPYFDADISSHARSQAIKMCQKEYGLKEIKKEKVTVLHATDLQLSSLKEGIYYVYDETGQFNWSGTVDFVYSKSTLEHMQNLNDSFDIMMRLLKKNGHMFHAVDFTSHGIYYKTPYDHLLFSPFMWKLMGSHRGIPNRILWSTYERLLKQKGFSLIRTIIYHKQTPATIATFSQLQRNLRFFSASDLQKQGVAFLATK